MPQTIEFLFDFGSPNAYLAWKILPEAAARSGVDISYLPVLLGGIFKATNNQPPMVAYGPVAGKLDYERVEMNRFIQRHGLKDFRFNPHFPVNTLLLMRGAIAALRSGDLDRYLKIGMRAMWEQGLNLSAPEVFVETMNAGGLDGAALLAATQDPEIKAELISRTSDAVARGVFGLPSFFIGDAMWFGKDRVRDMVETL